MKHEWHFLSFLQNSIWIFFYIIIVFITFVFNTTLTWIVLFFFTFLFFLNALILIPNLNTIQFVSHEIDENPLRRLFLTFSSTKNGPPLFPHLRMTFYFDADGEELYTSKKTALFFTKNETLSLSIDALPRNEYSNTQLTLSSFDFFGIFVKRKDCTLPFSFFILPKEQPHNADTLYNQLQQLQLVASKKDLTHNFNLKTIRDYQEHDHMSQVDWKLSEKKDTLLTKEFEFESRSECLFLFWGFDSSSYESLLSLYYSLYILVPNIQNYFWIASHEHLLKVEQLNQFAIFRPIEEEQAYPLQVNNLNVHNQTILIFFNGSSSQQQFVKNLFNASNEIVLITYGDDDTQLYINAANSRHVITLTKEVDTYLQENPN